MLNKIKYACKNCGWETSIRAEWSDLKPKRCMNKKCNASFLKSPKDLVITPPPAKKEKVKPAPKEDKEDDKKQTSSKYKTSRKTVKQHDKSEEEKQEDSE